MSKLSITFPFPPLGQNNIEKTATNGRYKTRRYKTPEAKNYRNHIMAVMRGNFKDVVPFKKSWDPLWHAVLCEYIFYIDYKRFFLQPLLKKNELAISARCPDTDNLIKFTQDCIFDYLGINDYFINDFVARRVPSMEHEHFHVNIEIVDLREHHAFSNFICDS